MKLDDYSNETTQLQCQAFADQLQKATACDLSIVLINGVIEDATRQATAAAMSCKGGVYVNHNQMQTEVIISLLKTAATILARMTGDTQRVMLSGPEGTFDVSGGDVREYIQR